MNKGGGVNIRAVLIALFAFYVAPLLPLTVVTSAPFILGADPHQHFSAWHGPVLLVLAWFYSIAPVGAAYLAAHLAKQVPLLHGAIVGIIGAVFAVLWMQSDLVLFELALALLVLSCGIFGGWLWKFRNDRRNIAL